jgi:hypothetical protein
VIGFRTIFKKKPRFAVGAQEKDIWIDGLLHQKLFR